MERTPASSLLALSAALLGRPISSQQARALHGLLRTRPAAERHALPVATALLDLLPLFRAGKRFRSLSPAAQAHWLERWASTLPRPLRAVLPGLKALAALAVYADQQTWPQTGYGGPWLGRRDLPVFPELIPPAAPALGNSERAVDVCVIGTGAGGASAAARLAEQGLQVMVLEAGPRISAADYTQRELPMMALLYADHGLSGNTDQSINILRGRGIGGSTLHNTGLVVPPPDGVIERWRAEHHFDAPQALLQLHLQRVLSALRAVPIPEAQFNVNNQRLRAGAQKLGWSYQQPLHNRLECSGCGYCMLGCAYNRKVNAAGAFLKDAVARGVQIQAEAQALRITGRRDAFQVQLRDATGNVSSVRARRVVLAAGALETPLLLRASGAGSSQTGARLRLHPAPLVFARFAEPVCAWRGLPQAVIVNEFASFEKDGRGGFLLLPNAGTAPALTAATAPALGAHHESFMRSYAHLASAAVLLHDEASGQVRGAAGRPRVHYWPDRTDCDQLLRGIAALARLFISAGAQHVYLPWERGQPRTSAELDDALRGARIRPHSLPLTSVHPQGSCALGGSAAESAVRPSGEVWSLPGVYVADASIFPTSIGVPPQVSIMAMAGIVADNLASGLGR